MPENSFSNRRSVSIENDRMRVTVLNGGGHIAELFDKSTSVNPLWVPKWPSIEPSAWSARKYPAYGNDMESHLLSGIMGHNLCMDIFGPPTEAEFAAGLSVHGEASVVDYAVTAQGMELNAKTTLPQAQLAFERTIRLSNGSPVAAIHETVENLAATDRPFAWQQHATLGAPFIERGVTEFRLSATKGKVVAADSWNGRCPLQLDAEFDWPKAPLSKGGFRNMEVYTEEPVSGALTAQLMDPSREQSFFMAYSKSLHCLCGYVWKRTDFPWMAIWEENHSRDHLPWKGNELTRGMEFGASPFPEPRRQMIERGRLFGAPAYKWIGAKQRLSVNYCAFVQPSDRLPKTVHWDGAHKITFTG